jgi:DNA-cytosine methyltransferase
MKVLSLFDGLSGGRLALERAGIHVSKYYSSEIDKNAIDISNNNWDDIIQIGDVTSIDFNKFKDIDLLIGGSPCQGFSFIGKVLNLEDPRSKLFFKFKEAFDKISPKYFMLENVIMSKASEKVISESLGVEPLLIDSALVSAQRRKRLYWTNIPNVTIPTDRGIKFKDILDNNEEFRDLPPFVYGKWGNKPRIKELNWVLNEKANTLTTKRSHTSQYLLNETKDKLRLMTPIEWERLQTLPENYTKGKGVAARCHAIGNGWTIDVIAHIFKGLK